MAKGKNKTKNQYPCGECFKGCEGTDCLCCEVCDKWTHYKCQHMTKEQFKVWTNISEGYICVKCRSLGNGDFDYLMGIKRLERAASEGYRKLSAVIRRESLYLEQNRLNIHPTADRTHAVVDKVAESILSRYHFVDRNMSPLETTGDGNCLFNAVSILLTGNENMSVELRYRSCLEMVLNSKGILNHPMKDKMRDLSPDYSEATKDCAKLYKYSSPWTMIALCNVINLPIQSVYPAVNGGKDRAFLNLSVTFKPQDNQDSNESIAVMWSGMVAPTHRIGEHTKIWTPNHFVALVDKSTVPSQKDNPRSYASVASSSSNLASVPAASPISFTSPAFIPKRKRVTILSLNDSLSSADDSISSIVDHSTSTPIPKTVPPLGISPASPEIGDRFVEESRKRKKMQIEKNVKRQALSPSVSLESNISLSNRYSSLNGDISIEDGIESDDEKEQPNNILPNEGKFMSVDELFDKVANSNSAFPKVAAGKKDNVFFVVDNSHNVNDDKSRSDFPDDCGVWDSKTGTTVNIDFVLMDTGKLKSVKFANGKYCVEKRSKGEQLWVPLETQPDSNTIVKMHRYYVKLKSCQTFRKRVTTFVALPEKMSNKLSFSVVEYCGVNQRVNLPHGNTKKQHRLNNKYIRTDPQILSAASKSVIQNRKTPIEVCNELAQDDSFAPTSKQVRDKVHRTKRDDNNVGSLNNVADEVLSVIGQIHSNPNIQRIIHDKNKPPSVIVYSEEQMHDFKSNCLGDNGSVIGVDRTFNLGPCFVTPVSYKNQAVVSKETGEHPIMLGPVFLHWDGEFSTYFPFFSHLKETIGNEKIKIGSDEEKAVTKSLQLLFPDATHLLCTKHLKDNVRRYLTDKVGCSNTDRKQIVKQIFGDDGVTNCDDSITLNSKCTDLQPYFQKYPKFHEYFEKRLKPLLWKYVAEPLHNGEIDELWTNNNAESINNRLKQAVDWKPQKVPILIDKISKISSIQFMDLRRALYGAGNYSLTEKMKKFRVQPDCWVNKTKDEKQKIFQKFIKYKKTGQCENKITATNAKFAIPSTSAIAKKPNQRKRARSERTR